MTACPICGDDSGIAIKGVPFCVCCVSQYPYANALRPGPNVSHRRASAPSLILRGAIVAALTFCAIYAWRLQ